MYKLVVLIVALLAGCATKQPMPAPMPTNYCAEGQTKDCLKWTTNEKNGLGGRGHGETIEEKP